MIYYDILIFTWLHCHLGSYLAHSINVDKTASALISINKLDKGDYPENLQVVFYPNKLRSFKPFMCLVLVLER